MIIPCQTEQDFQQLLADSETNPVLLLKHSTRCPISAGAQARYSRFAEEHPDIACWQVLVIEQRAISNLIATETGIMHQSPQVILFQHTKPVWHVAHHSINESAMTTALTSGK